MLCLSHSLNGCFVQCCRKNDEKVLKMKNSTFGKLTVGMLSVVAIAMSGMFVVSNNDKSVSETVSYSSKSSEISAFRSAEDFEGVQIKRIDGEDNTAKSDFTNGVEIVIPEPAPAVNPGIKKKRSTSSDKSSSNSESNEPTKPVKTTWESCIDRVDPNRTVDWRIGSYGHYGQASTNFVLLGDHTPNHRKCAVVYHEWFHTVHARKEGGIDNLFNVYGQSRVESIADCGALMLGADWVNYGCRSDKDQQKAREILGW